MPIRRLARRGHGEPGIDNARHRRGVLGHPEIPSPVPVDRAVRPIRVPVPSAHRLGDGVIDERVVRGVEPGAEAKLEVQRAGDAGLEVIPVRGILRVVRLQVRRNVVMRLRDWNGGVRPPVQNCEATVLGCHLVAPSSACLG